MRLSLEDDRDLRSHPSAVIWSRYLSWGILIDFCHRSSSQSWEMLPVILTSLDRTNDIYQLPLVVTGPFEKQ